MMYRPTHVKFGCNIFVTKAQSKVKVNTKENMRYKFSLSVHCQPQL